MKRVKLIASGSLLLCFQLLFALSGLAQSAQLKGVVKNEADQVGIPNATVSLVSNKSEASTTTDSRGSFTLNIPVGVGSKSFHLTVSSVGYEKKELNIEPGQTSITIVLKAGSADMLDNVVVTALGVKKDRKAVSYAVSEVKGSEFTQARENNIANALSGKVAGVNAAGLSTGPGGSSRVTIRGNGSMIGDNQPLYVINGMPLDNTVPGGAPTVNGITSNVDKGDGIAGINPDDIESITVLKGGTAAALYGSRASNGVILITTKKGRAQKGIGVEYNTTYTRENVAVTPDFQYEYGQGLNGTAPQNLGDAQQSGRKSWGAPIDPSTTFMAVDGQMHPYVAQKDNIKNFYQTGNSYTNSLAFSGGSEALQYRFSLANLSSNGILPNTSYKRKTANLSLSGKLSSKLSFEALAQYTLEQGRNRTGAGDALGNPNWTPLEISTTTDVRWLNPGYDSAGNESVWNDATIASNGYFVMNKWKEEDTKNRFIGQASISYELIKNLVFKGTVSRDFYNYNYMNIMPTGTAYTPLGEYAGLKSDLSETNSMVTVNYRTKFAQNFGLNALVGVNNRKYQNRELNLSGKNFIAPYFYSFSNLAQSVTRPFTGRSTTNSVFGSVDLDYKGLVYLTFTGREDWFSTLSSKNNHIFYPSVGGSVILSDAFKMPAFIDLAKVRASWAQVGGGAPDPYAINLTYSNVASGGQPLMNVTLDPVTNQNAISNPNLKPYTSTTYEAGIDLQTLGNRLGIDFTYYNRQTTNDIVKTTISPTSGFNTVILNVGELRNKGVELLLTGKPVRTANFAWTVSYNMAYNESKVVELAPGLRSVQIAQTVNGWATLNHIEGQPYGTIMGTRMVRDAQGNVVYNRKTYLPVMSDPMPLGSSVAPYTMGLTNEFRYKDFSLNILLDGKFGNKIFSIFELYATRMGKLKSTLPGRDKGLQLKGVDQTGASYDTTITQAGGVLRNYYDNYKVYSELFLHDGSFIKLRQVILSYNIPVSKIKLAKIQSASISFVARNLFILYRETKNFDPEQSFTNSNAQGFESIGLPRTRSYGLNLTIKL
jgi:TonB-linked SusC/RagA family outer membrane protein